eukprot:COSAG05_NODE_27_length_29281_cov_199.946919_2_plen_114_part_00
MTVIGRSVGCTSSPVHEPGIPKFVHPLFNHPRRPICNFRDSGLDGCKGPQALLDLVCDYLRTVCFWIDDWIILGASARECARNVAIVAFLLSSLGFILHPDKSEPVPLAAPRR